MTYNQELEYLTPYLQQLEMGTNGRKSDLRSSTVLLGQSGSNSECGLLQYMNQSQDYVPAIFLAGSSKNSRNNKAKAQAIGHAEALVRGKTMDRIEKELRDKKLPEMKVNSLKFAKMLHRLRPSTFIGYAVIKPDILGYLMALFDNVTYCASLLAGVDGYDQFK